MIPYCVKKHVFRFLGDIRWEGWRSPFWFVWGPKTFALKGKHYRQVAAVVKPGDILIRRFEGYVDKWLIPGYWNHAGIYVGNGQVVHAVSEGVIETDLIDFMRTDHLIVLRAERITRPWAIRRAKKAKAEGGEYDFAFRFRSYSASERRVPKRFSCTKLAAWCYPYLKVGKRRFGRPTIVADDFVNSPQLETVWDSREVVP